MARALYTLILYLALPVIAVRLLWRARLAPAYARRWAERFALAGELPTGPCLWVHAVSVGETLAALDMIRALQRSYPGYRLLVTTTTPTGSERVLKSLGDSVDHVYLPYDLPDCWWRLLRRFRPAALIVMETELWPNLLAACARRKIPVLLANARLSARSAAGYQRLGALTRPMLQNLSCVAAQQQDDADRFVALGLAPERVQVTGNIKFDLSLSDALRNQASQMRTQWAPQGQLMWLAASTHEGEDAQILSAFQRVRATRTDVRLLLVPRHPERFDRVYQLCQQAGWQMARRSQPLPAQFDVLIGDSMGELLAFYGASDIAFVGGSLVPTGGHNMIEPAAWAVPVLSGPHLHNFAEVSRLMVDAGGMWVARDSAELADQVLRLAGDAELRAAMGGAAQGVAEANRGALVRLLGLIDQLVDKDRQL